MFHDRIDLSVSSDDTLPKPEVKIILNGNSLYKPGMKAYFVENDSESASINTAHNKNTVGGVYCSCNKVEVGNAHVECSCDAVCTCHAVATCSCNANVSTTKQTVCSCNPYNSCPANCSCNAYTATTTKGGGGGIWVPCTGPCSCVPVH